MKKLMLLTAFISTLSLTSAFAFESDVNDLTSAEDFENSLSIESDAQTTASDPAMYPPGRPGYPPGRPSYPPGRPSYPPGRPGYPGPGYPGPGYPGAREVLCFARNMRGMTFEARGFNYYRTQREAMDRCYSMSRQCFEEGCRSF